MTRSLRWDPRLIMETRLQACAHQVRLSPIPSHCPPRSYPSTPIPSIYSLPVVATGLRFDRRRVHLISRRIGPPRALVGLDSGRRLLPSTGTQHQPTGFTRLSPRSLLLLAIDLRLLPLEQEARTHGSRQTAPVRSPRQASITHSSGTAEIVRAREAVGVAGLRHGRQLGRRGRRHS
jgi:hypothetical protein